MNQLLAMSHERRWRVNLAAGFIEHSSGLRIAFSALPELGHFEGTPRNIPHIMPTLTLSRLIQQGFNEFKLALFQQSGVRAVLFLKMH